MSFVRKLVAAKRYLQQYNHSRKVSNFKVVAYVLGI